MELVSLTNINDLIEEYHQKKEGIRETIDNFNRAVRAAEMACVVQGTFYEPIFYRSPSINSENNLIRNLAASFWRTVYSRLNLSCFISKSEKDKFEKLFSDPIIDINYDTVYSVFSDYAQKPRWHMLKGFAEVFTKLDQSYKSHDIVKVGVKALPKRIIVSGFYDTFGNRQNHMETIRSILNAISAYEGSSLVSYDDVREFYDGNVESLRGLSLKKFKNGNMHVIFDDNTCKLINKALAEFYGDVLCDTNEDIKPTTRQQSKTIAKDLQYYPTPKNVAELIISDVYIQDGMKILEPSCGDGRLIEAVLDVNQNVNVFGIEVSRERVLEARQKGFAVQEANFLDVTPTPEYDVIVMNPPFYGKHYQKHVEHAKKFLKEGGTLVSILPASARYSHGFIKDGYRWRDLPIASFAESGTNVPTGYIVYKAPKIFSKKTT